MQEDVMAQARSLAHTIRVLKQRVHATHTSLAAAHQGDHPWCDLTFPQVTMLLSVRDRGSVTIKELAEALQVSAPSASSMVERLVEQGALTREQSRRDRREVLVRLSPEAEKTIQQIEEHLLRCIAELLEKIGPEYAAMWCRVYDRIQEVLDDEKQGAAQAAS